MLRALTVALPLALGFMPAGFAQPTVQAAVSSSWDTLPVTPEDRDAALALKAPAFAGLWVNGPGVVLAVTSTDPAERQRVVGAVRAQRGEDLKSSGHDLSRVSFVTVKYNAAQLSRLRYLARGLRGWNTVGVDVKENKLKVEFQLPQYRDEAARFFASKGVPADALLLVAPSPHGHSSAGGAG